MTRDLLFSEVNEGHPAFGNLQNLPWFRLGVPLAGHTSIAEALSEAKLNFKVERRPLYYPIYGEDGSEVERLKVPGYYATVNCRDNSVVSVVGSQYRLLQNEEAFAAFQPMVSDGTLRLDMAGPVAATGGRIWILARLLEPYRVAVDDLVSKYILLVNSHENRKSIMISGMTLRMVDATSSRLNRNPVKGYNEYSISIRHGPKSRNRARRATSVIGKIIRNQKEYEQMARRLVRVNIKRNDVYKTIEHLFPQLRNAEPGTMARAERSAASIIELLEAEPIAEARGTAWSLYCSVAAYVDHRRSTKGKSETQRLFSRLRAIWFGRGAKLKDRALKYISEIYSSP